jgi:hypothetical protein
MTIGILGMGAGQSLLSAILRSKLARLGRIRDRREEITAGMLQRFNHLHARFTPCKHIPQASFGLKSLLSPGMVDKPALEALPQNCQGWSRGRNPGTSFFSVEIML